jgi:hypothetical protein
VIFKLNDSISIDGLFPQMLVEEAGDFFEGLFRAGKPAIPAAAHNSAVALSFHVAKPRVLLAASLIAFSPFVFFLDVQRVRNGSSAEDVPPPTPLISKYSGKKMSELWHPRRLPALEFEPLPVIDRSLES